MRSLLILPRIKVENANAISGFVYGFPAVTHFLGYVHALSRDLDSEIGVKLGGCGIVCHNYQVHAYKNGGGGEYIFSLTRNPLTKEGKTAPFNEEGKVHMEVSLLIECDFTSDDFDFNYDSKENEQSFEKLIYRLAMARRLAGGVIIDMSAPKFHALSPIQEEDQALFRRIRYQMLPGFVLCDRSNIFEKYLSEHPNCDHLRAFLDFYTLKSKAISLSESENEDKEAKWEMIPKPCSGWIVPLQLGYKAISPLYEAGKVACARNFNVPFSFVEPIYGLGEWLGPHRVANIESIIWRYQRRENFYVCSTKINNEL
jgi:CRISPR-associated protein Csy2